MFGDFSIASCLSLRKNHMKNILFEGMPYFIKSYAQIINYHYVSIALFFLNKNKKKLGFRNKQNLGNCKVMKASCLIINSLDLKLRPKCGKNISVIWSIANQVFHRSKSITIIPYFVTMELNTVKNSQNPAVFVIPVKWTRLTF